MNRILILSEPLEASQADKLRKSAGLRRARVLQIPCLTTQRHPVLTRRQTEVLRGMALGLRTKEIAKKLGVAVKTVETHRQQLMARLKIRHIPGLVRYALKSGVISADWLLEG